mmetsp:Transcript_44062/g.133465  ORF Transcript_44062/g.133465 Transcript_44062/m.133465 type:complete len:233 (-) Transcript_44062:154-852(-)
MAASSAEPEPHSDHVGLYLHDRNRRHILHGGRRAALHRSFVLCDLGAEHGRDGRCEHRGERRPRPLRVLLRADRRPHLLHDARELRRRAHRQLHEQAGRGHHQREVDRGGGRVPRAPRGRGRAGRDDHHLRVHGAGAPPLGRGRPVDPPAHPPEVQGVRREWKRDIDEAGHCPPAPRGLVQRPESGGSGEEGLAPDGTLARGAGCDSRNGRDPATRAELKSLDRGRRWPGGG